MDEIINTTESQINKPDTPSTYDTSLNLPDGYLSEGYYAITEKGDKYLRPEYVSHYAQNIASKLTPMKPSDLAALLREMKKSKKRSLPFEARLTAASEMIPKAITLAHRKKAPKMLLNFV